MIKRYVKMTFKPEHIQDFKDLFHKTKDLIAAAEGCKHLELLQDSENECVFFTYSIWEDVSFLEQYRSSDLFLSVWAKTKLMFADKPLAWTMKVVKEN